MFDNRKALIAWRNLFDRKPDSIQSDRLKQNPQLLGLSFLLSETSSPVVEDYWCLDCFADGSSISALNSEEFSWFLAGLFIHANYVGEPAIAREVVIKILEFPEIVAIPLSLPLAEGRNDLVAWLKDQTKSCVELAWSDDRMSKRLKQISQIFDQYYGS